MNESTLKTVIGICPGFYVDKTNRYYWLETDDDGDGICTDFTDPEQWFLDALAAAAVRVVKNKGLAVSVEPWAIKIGEPRPKIHVLFHATVFEGEGDDTERTLTAIAEFVEKHPNLFPQPS